MKPRYIIAFVLNLEDRKKLSPIRAEVCKQSHSTQALQSPIHMSLTKTIIIKNYNYFEKEFTKLCLNEKKQTLNLKKFTDVLPERFWSGITILNSSELTKLHKKLEKLINKYAVEKKHMRFTPHITLTFPAKVAHLKKVKIPIKTITLDKLTVLKQEDINKPYKVHKQFKLK